MNWVFSESKILVSVTLVRDSTVFRCLTIEVLQVIALYLEERSAVSQSHANS